MKTWIKILIALIFGFLISLFIFKPWEKKVENKIIEVPVYYEDLKRIGELEKEVAEKKEEIEKLKGRVQEIKEVVKIEKERIKLLSPDSSVSQLRIFLGDYTGELCDSLPTLTSDSLALLSPDNIRDINSVFLDYNGAKEIIGEQDRIIKNDSLIIMDLDSINGINNKVRESLENRLASETKEKKLIMYLGLGASLVLGGLLWLK